MSELIQRYETLWQRISRIRVESDLNTKTVLTKTTEKEQAVKKHSERLTRQQQIDEILLGCKLIIEHITTHGKSRLEQFLTYALRTIFTDKDYAIELELKEDTKRPAINVVLVSNGVRQDIRDSVGGGIITTIGLLMQIYYVEVFGKSRIMFIDEGLKEISKIDDNGSVNYLNNVLLFLKSLAQERQWSFIVVTHDDSVKNIADKVYRVIDGKLI